uniref:Uncharacterized protein n=1 Tax=Anguilla anguilla TaxID=7936 RepID=A0A0E9WAE8_ANGAN
MRENGQELANQKLAYKLTLKCLLISIKLYEYHSGLCSLLKSLIDSLVSRSLKKVFK